MSVRRAVVVRKFRLWCACFIFLLVTLDNFFGPCKLVLFSASAISILHKTSKNVRGTRFRHSRQQGSTTLFMQFSNISEGSSLPKYLRLSITPATQGSPRKMQLQTCVRKFRRRRIQTNEQSKRTTYDDALVDLHAQVHFGSAEYFHYFNDPTEFGKNYDRILYELIVSDSLMEIDPEGKRRVKGKNTLMPSLSDQKTAQQCDLVCQLDVIDFSQNSDWICSDYSGEDIVEKQKSFGKNSKLPGAEIFQSLSMLPGAEIFQSLVMPKTPMEMNLGDLRLFSNLFLSGQKLATGLRLVLWTIPVPEISVLLLDWSSMGKGGRISPLALPVLENLLRGNFSIAQKLVFSQMIVSGQANEGSSSFIIGERNEKALQELEKSTDVDGCRNTALLYGALHCRDMHRKLNKMGYQLIGEEKWRTAWAVNLDGDIEISSSSDETNSKSRINRSIVGIVAVSFYLLVSGVDWIATLQDIEVDASLGHGYGSLVTALAYLLRHVALYFSLAKFIIQWDIGLFGGDNSFR
mmetsp:Transcript_2395/g.2782  ORF Transcript_2395/g.2782 Transcript_2395/m.2782 type:complete len:520 (-) Transcript_2395:62-1621(-)